MSRRNESLRRTAALVAGCLWIASISRAMAAEEAEGPQVVLRWALGALDTGSAKPTAIQRDTQLESGALNFLVEPRSPGSVMIGGQTRGGATGTAAIDQLAVEVSAERFYGKTITIDH